jgi:AcrR family transcriptional regulator
MPVYAPQMRKRLAQSAFKLFSEHGIRNVNLDEVAAHAGVTKGSLYWHYKSKKELILAACAYYYRNWQRRAHAEIAAVADATAQLEGVLRFSVQSCLFDRANRVFTTEIFALSLQDDDIRASWKQFYDTVRELIIGLLRAAQARGEVGRIEPREAADWMLATVEGLKQRASFEPEICTPSQRDAIVRGLMKILTNTAERMLTAAR